MEVISHEAAVPMAIAFPQVRHIVDDPANCRQIAVTRAGQRIAITAQTLLRMAPGSNHIDVIAARALEEEGSIL